MTFSLSVPQRTAVAAAGFSEPDDELDFRQLRHHTKNALQRIIAQVDACGLRRTAKGRELADEIERRICLSARVSDALFGLRERPAALAERLTTLAQSLISLLTTSGQDVTIEVVASGDCPPSLHATVLRVAHEMLGNAVKHGLHQRSAGKIELQVRSGGDGRTVLSVSDDGWGFDAVSTGEGLSLMRSLAARHGGRVELLRRSHWTVARLDLPAPEDA